MKLLFKCFSISLFIILFLIHVSVSQNLLNGPEDIIFDIQANRILVSNWVSGAIVQIDSTFQQSYYKTGLPHAHGMELRGNTLYVASNSRIIGVRLANSQTIWQIDIPDASRLGHITIDDSLNLYASDWSVHKIYKIHIPSQTYSTIVSSGINTPVGIMINSELDRLVLCQFLDNMSLHAISLSNFLVTPIATANYDRLDAIVRDLSGNFYVSVWSSGEIIRYDNDFSNMPEIISTGHNGPSGLGYSSSEHILGVTNYNTNTISLIPLASTAIEIRGSHISSGFHLYQNYPNPFNPNTVISSNMTDSKKITLTIYNLLGRTVAVLINERQTTGYHSIEYDASGLPGGIYFYRLEKENFIKTRKMVLMK